MWMENPNLKPIFRGIYLKFWHWQTDFENELTLSQPVVLGCLCLLVRQFVKSYYFINWFEISKIATLTWSFFIIHIAYTFQSFSYFILIGLFILSPLWSDQRQGYQATWIKFPVIGRFGSGASVRVSWFFKLLHYHPSVNHSSKLAFVLFGIKYNQLWKAELFSSHVVLPLPCSLHWALQHERA